MKTIKAREMDLSVNIDIDGNTRVLKMKDGFVLTNRFMQSVIKRLHETEVKENQWLALLNGQGEELPISDQEKSSLLNDPPTVLGEKTNILSTIYDVTLEELNDKVPGDVINKLWDHVMEEIQDREKK